MPPPSSALLDLTLKSPSGYQVSTIFSTWYNFSSPACLLSPLTLSITVLDSHLCFHTRSYRPTVDPILGSYRTKNCHISCWRDVSPRNQHNSRRGNSESFTVWSCCGFYDLHLHFRLRSDLVDSPFAIPGRNISLGSQIEGQRVGVVGWSVGNGWLVRKITIRRVSLTDWRTRLYSVP